MKKITENRIKFLLKINKPRCHIIRGLEFSHVLNFPSTGESNAIGDATASFSSISNSNDSKTINTARILFS